MNIFSLLSFFLLYLISGSTYGQTVATLGETSIGTSCTNGANATNFDTLAQCSVMSGAGTYQKAPLFIGAVTSPPYTDTICDSTKAGMLQYTGSGFSGCNGTNWLYLAGSSSNYLGPSSTQTNLSRNGDITTGLFSATASTVSIATSGVERVRITNTTTSITNLTSATATISTITTTTKATVPDPSASTDATTKNYVDTQGGICYYTTSSTCGIGFTEQSGSFNSGDASYHSVNHTICCKTGPSVCYYTTVSSCSSGFTKQSGTFYSGTSAHNICCK